MQITVNLNDEELDELVTNGIKNLSETAIQEIAKEALTAYLAKEMVMEKLIFEKRQYYNDNWTPREWIIAMLSKGFNGDEVAEYRDKMLDILKDDKKRQGLLTDTLAKALSSVFFSHDMQSEFYRALINIQEVKEAVEKNGSTG